MSSAPIQVAGVERFDIYQKILGPLNKRNPKQCEFLHQLFDLHKEYILYGGAAGGGKSYILRWACMLFLIMAWKVYKVRNVRAGLFCEDYPTLRDRQLSKMVREFPPFMGKLRKSEAEGLIWELPNDDTFGGGFIAPRNLDKPEKYDSVEFGIVAVDELTKNPPEIFEELNKRIRWPGFPEDFIFPFIAGSNPGGRGHGWVKGLWIDKEFPVELQASAKNFAFVQAFAQDNQYNPKNYVEKKLLTLPEQLRRAYAFGDWEAFVGQYFGEWRTTIHICPRFKIPHYWTRFTTEDWGFASPWCRLWFAVSPEGLVIAYREQYELHRLPEYMAKEGKRLSEGETIKYKLGDPAMWQEVGRAYGGSGVVIADQLHEHGWTLQKADNQRIAGWQHVRHFLAWERNAKGVLVRPPMFQVMEGTCPNLVRTMPTQIFSKLVPEDLDTDAEDHGPDTLRMGLMSRPKPTIVPLEEMDSEWAEAAMRAAHEEKEARKRNTADLT